MLEYIPAIKMYRSTTQPPKPAQLRAWVENPFELFESDPAYLLVEITDASQKQKVATCREVNAAYEFAVPFAKVHTVHTYLERIGEIMQIFGEPREVVKC